MNSHKNICIYLLLNAWYFNTTCTTKPITSHHINEHKNNNPSNSVIKQLEDFCKGKKSGDSTQCESVKLIAGFAAETYGKLGDKNRASNMVIISIKNLAKKGIDQKSLEKLATAQSLEIDVNDITSELRAMHDEITKNAQLWSDIIHPHGTTLTKKDDEAVAHVTKQIHAIAEQTNNYAGKVNSLLAKHESLEKTYPEEVEAILKVIESIVGLQDKVLAILSNKKKKNFAQLVEIKNLFATQDIQLGAGRATDTILLANELKDVVAILADKLEKNANDGFNQAKDALIQLLESNKQSSKYQKELIPALKKLTRTDAHVIFEHIK